MSPVGKIALIVSLFIIMMGMGLSLTKDDFKRVLKHPKAVFVGFLNQIILLPIIAYCLIQFFEVSNEIAIGVMILSACPGGDCSSEHSSDSASCYPLLVEVFAPQAGLLDEWDKPSVNAYDQTHGAD